MERRLNQFKIDIFAPAMVISGELVSKLINRIYFGVSTTVRVGAHDMKAVVDHIVAETYEGLNVSPQAATAG